MIQLGTVLWLTFAVTAGVGLFQVKYEVQALEEELTRLHRQILRDQEAIHVLHAEWSYLNEPRRLAELARRHLGMEPVSADRLSSFDALPDPLPLPPVAPPRVAPGPGVEHPDGRPVVGETAAEGAVFVSSGKAP